MAKSFEEFVDEHENSGLGGSRILCLEEQLQNLANSRSQHVIEVSKKAPSFRCGVISCTHLGSLYEEIAVNNAAYKWFDDMGIKDVFHCGDMTEGSSMRKGHEHEIHRHGADAQIDWAIEQYPRVKGITTHLISGNHDAVHMRNGGVDVCRRISDARSDINYIGRDYGRFIVRKNGSPDVKIDMIHPDGGSSYALSYKPQKIIEQIEAGSKPDLLLIGHFHKAMTLPTYRGVSAILAGCTQRQTGFMRRNGLAAHIGVHIVEITVLDGQKVLTSTFRAFYPSSET